MVNLNKIDRIYATIPIVTAHLMTHRDGLRDRVRDRVRDCRDCVRSIVDCRDRFPVGLSFRYTLDIEPPRRPSFRHSCPSCKQEQDRLSSIRLVKRIQPDQLSISVKIK